MTIEQSSPAIWDDIWKRRWEIRIDKNAIFTIYSTGLCSVKHNIPITSSDKNAMCKLISLCLTELKTKQDNIFFENKKTR